ncbi:MAG: class II aldolase/adducin family protein [Rhodospirillales bacterium]|nr:class II aldolase/adducin family protein [Rhodospirillales bacterium]
MSTAAPLRAAIARAYRDLGRRGFTPGSAGNVSARTRTGMLITPSGSAAEQTRPETIVALTLDGAVTGRGTPSSEWPMHAAIYRATPEAGAIVHTHAPACTALAALGQPLPAFHYMVVAFGGAEIRCAPYVTFGTDALAEAALAALAGRRACLLANHGMIVHAPDIDQALEDTIVLESLAAQYLLARAAGTPRLLTAEECAAARARLATYGRNARPK